MLVMLNCLRLVKNRIDDGKSVSWLLETCNQSRLVKNPIDDGK